MKKIFDASSLINLEHGGALHLINDLKLDAWCGPLVLDECRSITTSLKPLITAGTLRTLDDAHLPGDIYLDLLSKHGLGVGETECIAFALSDDSTVVCCDDGKARKVAGAELGEARVVGTLRILARAVSASLMDQQRALAIYQTMKRRGGFLPIITPAKFASLVSEG